MQREINKLLKRASAEKLKYNHKECIELYNIIGGMYTEIGSYEEAIHYHKEALQFTKLIGDRLKAAVTLRYIGEARAALGEFNKAVDYIKKYLELSEKTDNKVEIQRAWTTLGRVYLMQAQDLKDKSNVIGDHIKSIAVEAERRFEKALEFAKLVKDQVEPKEYLQMRSGLLVNIGLVKDICGHFDETVSKFDQAIALCRQAKLKEDLYRYQIILAVIFRSKSSQKKYIQRAFTASNEALTIAKQIGKKVMICEALIEVGLVKIWQHDFKGAKRTFALAYLEKSPSEDDHAKAIRLTKLAHMISENYDRLQSHENISAETRIKLRDKLGDLFVALDAYKLASESYKKAWEDAKLCHAPKTEQARILYSMAETYADDYQFEHALLCYEKELAYRQGNNSEQCKTLIKIAHMHEYLSHGLDKVSASYEQALEKADQQPKLMYLVLKDYVPYLKKHNGDKKKTGELEEKLLNIKSYEEVMEDIEREEAGLIETGEDLEDEIANVEDIITDDEDNDEVLLVGRRRARGGTKKFKPNEVGDTPLHEACIKGDLRRVVSLLEQGHEINPCDNAGWIPLHEACNHGHGEIVDVLLENGADVNNRGLKGTTPLHDAATNGHYDIMRSLIRHGANVIALTDTGETVLSCLKDYKKRNYSKMSNSEMSDYRTMENELMNLMDRSGFNLMSEKKEKAAAGAASRNVSSTSRYRSQTIGLRNEPSSSRPAEPQESASEYRNVIRDLKRRNLPDARKDLVQDADLPANIDTSLSTSAPTKEWLIDDVSRQHRTLVRRSNRLEELMLLESDSESEEEQIESNTQRVAESESDKEIVTVSSGSDEVNRKSVADELDDEPIIESENMSQLDQAESPSGSLLNDQVSNHCSNLVTRDDPVRVTIEDKKLVIPLRDQRVTIKELKEIIADRYALIAKGKPRVELSLACDSSCLLFDDDLCHYVITGPVLAKVESWILKPMKEAYLDACKELAVESHGSIEHELANIERIGNKLDLSHIRVPNSQVKAMLSALALRDFTCASLNGTAIFFANAQRAESSLETVFSWRKLSRLELKCVGLGRREFEIICAGKYGKLAGLESLNLGYNLILFRDKSEFKHQIELLLNNVAPKLQLLNVEQNLLEFVKSLVVDMQQQQQQQTNLAKVLEIGARNQGAASGEQQQQKEFEIVGAFEQNDIVLY